MKRLIIVRHAKSSWELPVEDYNRSLMERGIRRAQDHAKILKEHLGFEPSYWVSSYATRALHTAVIFADQFGCISKLNIQKELYTFNATKLLNQIKQLPEDKDSVILFSHNEACHEVVNQISSNNLEEFKTASVALISFDEDSWNDISKGSLELLISKGQITHGEFS